MSLPAEAQAHLDAANALFVGRYRAGLDHLGRWAVTDGQRRKLVGVDRDPVKATRRALTSARLSANNGNRRDDTPPNGAASRSRPRCGLHWTPKRRRQRSKSPS